MINSESNMPTLELLDESLSEESGVLPLDLLSGLSAEELKRELEVLEELIEDKFDDRLQGIPMRDDDHSCDLETPHLRFIRTTNGDGKDVLVIERHQQDQENNKHLKVWRTSPGRGNLMSQDSYYNAGAPNSMLEKLLNTKNRTLSGIKARGSRPTKGVGIDLVD